MFFYKSRENRDLPTVVWNPAKNRALAIFEDGVFESDDPDVCAVLANMGYESEGEMPVIPEPVIVEVVVEPVADEPVVAEPVEPAIEVKPDPAKKTRGKRR